MIQNNHNPNTIAPLDSDLRKRNSCFVGGWPGLLNNNSNRNTISTNANNNNISCNGELSLSSRFFDRIDSQNMKTTVDTTKEEVDMFMASSMAKLSFKDRQKYQEDLHGVATNKPEDPEQIAMWMNEMQTHLAKETSSRNQESAYQLAETMDSNYVQDYKFRLMFLRGNRYKPKEAAQQILSFFEMKKRLFGVQKLTKNITLEDLDEDDKEVLRTGGVRLLPCYDSAGRTILLGLPGLLDVNKLENDLRARFYFFMSVLQSERAQVKGVVVVSYALGRFANTSGGAGFLDQTKLSMALPIHFAGIHLCCEAHEHLQYVIISACLRMIPPELRARFRLHLGSPLECQYALKAFGIRSEPLPSCDDNTKQEPDYHMRWYKECEWREAMEACNDVNGGGIEHLPQRMPVEPFESDVLFGGRSNNSNGGNRRLRIWARNHASQYDVGTNQEKRELVEKVIHEVKQTGGRFLDHRAGGGGGDSSQHLESWVELSAEDVFVKVAQIFRNSRRPKAAGNNSNTAEAAKKVARARRPSLEWRNPQSILSHHQMQASAGRLPSDQPTEFDVLFGRKRNNEGNKRVRQLVGELATEYDKANKARKTEIADSVVHEIQRQGGRFMKQTEGDSSTWEEVPDDFARNKISKHFRNNRRPPTASNKMRVG